jgi:hypothetical protein
MTNTCMEATGIYLHILFIYYCLFSNTISNTIFPRDSGSLFTTAECADYENQVREVQRCQ